MTGTVARMAEGRITWRDIANDLREAIRSGKYAPDAQVPSRSKLMDQYGVASQTVMNAINHLRAEGLIVGRPGSGWYVHAPRPVIRLARNRLERAERGPDAELGGRTARTEVSVRIEPADEEVATALELEPGTPVLVRDHVMYADDEPIQLAASYFPRSLTEGTAIEEDDTGPGGVYARLEETGHQLERFEELVRLGRAAEREAAQLGVPIGTPLLRIIRLARTCDRVVEINRITAHGERYELHYALPAK